MQRCSALIGGEASRALLGLSSPFGSSVHPRSFTASRHTRQTSECLADSSAGLRTPAPRFQGGFVRRRDRLLTCCLGLGRNGGGARVSQTGPAVGGGGEKKKVLHEDMKGLGKDLSFSSSIIQKCPRINHGAGWPGANEAVLACRRGPGRSGFFKHASPANLYANAGAACRFSVLQHFFLIFNFFFANVPLRLLVGRERFTAT